MGPAWALHCTSLPRCSLAVLCALLSLSFACIYSYTILYGKYNTIKRRTPMLKIIYLRTKEIYNCASHPHVWVCQERERFSLRKQILSAFVSGAAYRFYCL